MNHLTSGVLYFTTAYLTSLPMTISIIFVYVAGIYWLDSNIVQGMQYALSTSRTTWQEAEVVCRNESARLAHVDSESCQQFIADGLQNDWFR